MSVLADKISLLGSQGTTQSGQDQQSVKEVENMHGEISVKSGSSVQMKS